jgi:tetratricopeptide (TPR) repeat protein
MPKLSRRFTSVTVASLLIFLFSGTFSVAQIQSMAPKTATRAVVVGISNYQNIAKLRFAHRDAEAFAEYLRSAAGGHVPDEHIMLLTNEKATQAQIGSALFWLFSDSQEGDLAIIYFSGHGDVETKLTKNGYLLAFDVNKSTYMAGGAISIRDLQDIVTNLTLDKKVQVLVITDACHSGNLAGSESGGSLTTATALANSFGKDLKIMSCKADELSLEDERWGGGHSVFSYYLLDGLRGLADVDEDRKVSLLEIGRFLQDSVRRATASLGLRQTPQYKGDDDQVITKVDAATLAALKQKYNPQPTATLVTKDPKTAALNSDSAVLRLYRDFEEAMRTGHLLDPEAGSAYAIFQQIKDHPAMRTYKNGMRNDLAVKLQDEAQKAISDYLSADAREMRRRWGMDDNRYKLYPEYLNKAADLLGVSYFSYKQIKAKANYFSGLNLRLRGEKPENVEIKDSLFNIAKRFQESTLLLDSTAAYAYNELGLLERRFNNFEQSIVFFKKATQLSPTWGLPWANLCNSYNALGQSEESENCGLMAIALDSTSALAHYNLGYIYFLKQDNEKVEFHYKKTIEYSPDYSGAYFNLGLYYFKRKNYIKAEQLFEEYRKLFPDDAELFQNLGETSLKLEKITEAKSHFLRALELNPKYPKPYLSLSETYLSENDFENSEIWFKKFTALAPDDPDGFFYLALRNSQNYTKAIGYLETAFQKGFKDYERLNDEKRFAPLRNKPEYIKLVKQYFPDRT